MILTLTANPSIDETIDLAGPLRPGEVHRVGAAGRQPGGKGINISRAAVAAGVATCAVVPADADDDLVARLHEAGIDATLVPTGREVRVNLTITEPDGTTTKLNSPGAEATPQVLAQLSDAVVERLPAADWVVLAGSLPPGAPVAWYAELTRELRARGARVAVDTSDAPLRASVAGLEQGAPHLMKPNGDELASVVGADGEALEADPAAAACAGLRLLDRGLESALITLGGNGAVLLQDGPDGPRAWHAAPPPTTVVSTVGAGDSSLFGYLLATLRGLTPPECLALAVAYGSAAAGLPGTTVPLPDQVRPDLVEVCTIPFDRGDS